MNNLDLAQQLQELLGGLSDDALDNVVRNGAQLLEQRTAQNRLLSYRPYPKQREFHAAGKDYRERCLMAANQVGKTWAAGFEVAMHVTGIYPPDWEGRRFDRPTRWIVGSESTELMRKGAQRILLGPPEDEAKWGTGAIPKANLIATPRKQGVPDAIAAISVRHVIGGTSSIQMASYDQGRTKWQADTLDGVWLDEECSLELYTEALTRTNAVEGPIILTFTPMWGITEVVRRYIVEKVTGTHITSMTLEDAEHYTPEQRERIRATYPAHERAARTEGVPMRGSGAVFPLDPEDISCKPFPIPDYWPQIAGLDFGWDHPSAAVRIAWDRDNDILYVTAAHRARNQTPVMFAGAVRHWGAWLPFAWPHDGLQHDKGSGEQLAAQYRTQGLNMPYHHATFENGSNGLEAGIAEMLDRMETGRLQVFETLRDWFEEFNTYHRREGIIVKENDDLLSATRYAMMMKRIAVPARPVVTPNPTYLHGPPGQINPQALRLFGRR